MSLTVGSIRIGTASANAIHAADLGKTIEVDGRRYRMVKATAALAAAASKLVSTALSTGTPTWVVGLTTTAGDPNCVGVIPAGQVGSDGSTGLLANDYFYVQVTGACSFLAGSTATLAAALKVDTAGQVVAVGSADATNTIRIGRGTNSAGATAAGQAIKGFVEGIM